ncbi:MAG: 16S rRNA (adenine(1518)-N(6)/adenine(1519)-N(6))-dimethyltransferase RsmA [Lentisphaeria bacterium]|nr:16S rRNA (adenine(1518)-N(6)/adenine(1519)-N(6))-dimethyltransferase RsmA [Lentisphaeria bacterium]
MKKAELSALFKRLDFHPSRRLGQNFLLDGNLLDAMLKHSAPRAGEEVLEVGPGAGVLTERLLASGCHLTAIELDHRLADWLAERFAGQANFRLLQADACKVDYAELFGARPFRCIANLPYSCSSVFLARACSGSNPPQELYILLQKEMGSRLLAGVGSKEYGALSARLAWRYESKLLRDVPPQVFFPEPEVQSCFVKMSLKKRLPQATSLELAEKLVARAFSQRRKISLRLLQSLLPQADMSRAFAELELHEESRAEHISPAQYLTLAELLLAKQKNPMK